MVKFPDEVIHDSEQHSKKNNGTSKQKKIGRLLSILGPGIVTGAADDDPSGIATYSQAGAKFGYGTLWTMLVTFPLMTAVQEACMRIGAVTGKGLAQVTREHYSKTILYPIVLLVVLANTLNIGADIGAMAASAELIFPNIPYSVFAIGFAILIILLEVLVPYRTYIRILKWLAITLFAYIITAFLIDIPWSEVVKATVIPTIELNSSFLYVIVGIFGTTISPYLFFWQTSNVVEDEISDHRLAQKGGIPKLTKSYLKKLRIDTIIGMLFSNTIAWFIILVGAVVLNQSGVTNINSAADAAKAIEPLVNSFPNSGFLAKLIFAIGIIGIGLQSIPVLAGSSAYAVAETFNWREGLFRKFKQSRNFYLVIIVGTLAGLMLNFSGFNPIKALVFTAVFNGIAAVPLIYLIAKISNRQDIMGEYKNSKLSNLGLQATFVIMTTFATALLISLI